MAENRRGAPRVTRLLVFLAIAVGAHAIFLEGMEELSKLFPTPKPPPEPEELDVAWVTMPDDSQVTLPELTPPEPEAEEPTQAEPDKRTTEKQDEDKLRKPDKLRPKEKPPEPELAKPEPPKIELPKPEPPKAEPPKPEPPKVAVVPPPQPQPPPQPEAKKEKPKPPPRLERKKMVEVDDDEHVVNEPPPDVEYYSDKNRAVKEETRDTRTNLEKMSKGTADMSAESDDTTSKDIGGPEDKVRQLEDSEASSLDATRRSPMTAHNGDEEKASGVKIGTQGDDGQGGRNGGGGQAGEPGALSMRNVEGRGAPGDYKPSPNPAPAGADDDAPLVAMSTEPGGGADEDGKPGKAGKSGKGGRRGPKLRLEQEDYARIVGQDKVAEEEREVAKRQGSHKKGRWEQKLDRIHASLENFTPEVKPGNQTALGTRAHPFALYIARMHRNIHELWGYGFLEDLDGKSASNPMNDRTLEVTMEIVINPDGTVDKVTIVKPSGVLTFDVAAIDTVMSAGPYEETPDDIRSGDGKVYLHWTFHRDERMCTPYFADPFILDNAKDKGGEEVAKQGLPDPSEEVARRKREAPERLRREKGSPTDGQVEVAHVNEEQHEAMTEGGMTTERGSGGAGGDGGKDGKGDGGKDGKGGGGGGGDGGGHEGDAARANANIPTPDDPAAEATALAWANGFEKGDLAAMVAASSFPFSSGGQVVASDAAGVKTVWKTVLDEIPKRSINEWKLLSAAGYRALFGHLPPGGEDGSARLYLVVKVGSERLTMDVTQDANGIYRIVGLTR